MLTFNLKKEWFEKIKSGEKTHEYREFKPYWENRIRKLICNTPTWEPHLCEFVCGYAKKDNKDKRLKAKIKSIRLKRGNNIDLVTDGYVYDIEFELI